MAVVIDPNEQENLPRGNQRVARATQRKRRSRGGLLLVALVAIAAVVFGVNKLKSRADHGEEAAAAPADDAKAAGAQRTIDVNIAPVQVRNVQRRVAAVGTFHGFDEVTVAAEVAGRVVRIYPNREPGDIVRPGDPLLDIDPIDYELALEETKRALELEAARIGLPIPRDEDFTPQKIRAILGSRDFSITKLPTVVRAVEQEELARTRLERSKRLRETNTISQEELDQRSTEYQVALTNRYQAEMDAQAVVAGIKHRCVLLEMAQRKLHHARVLVPEPTRREGMPENVEYTIVQRKVTEGEMVKDASGMSSTVFELVMDTALKLLATVPERYVGEIQAKQRVEVRVEAYPNRAFEGEVTRVNPTIDRVSRSFEVEIRVLNPKRELKPGGFAKAEILTRNDGRAPTVPNEAVVSFAGSTKVFVVRDGKAHAIPVARGVEGLGWVELVLPANHDLRNDDQVVVKGQEKLAEGTPVQLPGQAKSE